MTNHRIEHKKLELEKLKTKIEVFKLFALLVPILTALILLYNNFRLQKLIYQNELHLKIAEMVISAKDPIDARGRIEYIKELFPTLISKSLASDIDERPHYNEAEIIDKRKELFIRLYVQSDDKNEFLKMWLKLFPEDKWIKDVVNSY